MVKILLIAASLLALSACGGGDWESSESVSCRSALADASVNLTAFAPYNSEQYGTDEGIDVRFTNGEPPASPRYVVHAACTLVGGKVTSVTLPGGAVVKV